MQRIGILYNPLSEETSILAAQTAAWIQGRGLTTWMGVSHNAREDPALIKGCDLLLCLGGDGTVLRAARLAIPNHIPILPVAMGHLSFMSEAQPGAIVPTLERVLSGDYWIDDRSLVDVELRRRDEIVGRWTALNEVLMTRAELVRAVVVEVLIDGTPLTTYHSDGVIVATATGSTAYALAAGGPVMDPRTKAVVLVAVAPHLTSIPSLVVHESTEITLRLCSYYPVFLSIDAQITIPMEVSDVVVARRSTEVARFARISEASDFYRNLTQRLRRA